MVSDIGLPVATHEATSSHNVHAPSAMGGGSQRFWSLTFMLARTEFKLRFFGSVLGYVWTLMRPLMLFGVMLFVFTDILNINKGNPVSHYPEYLLESLILFTFFQEATSGSVACLVGRENLLRRVRFPSSSAAVGDSVLPIQPVYESHRRVHLHPCQRRGTAC